MGVQKYPTRVWGAVPILTNAGYYPLKQVYNFIDICREEKMSYDEICRILNVDKHRIIFFEHKRGIHV